MLRRSVSCSIFQDSSQCSQGNAQASEAPCPALWACLVHRLCICCSVCVQCSSSICFQMSLRIIKGRQAQYRQQRTLPMYQARAFNTKVVRAAHSTTLVKKQGNSGTVAPQGNARASEEAPCLALRACIVRVCMPCFGAWGLGKHEFYLPPGSAAQRQATGAHPPA